MSEFTRRQALAAGGVLALGMIGCGDDDDPAATTSQPPATTTQETETTAADCILTPEQTEGPYYLPDSMVRSDVTEDREGAPLELELVVQHAEKCEPIQNATVEIWHCDAEGAYSGVDGDGGTFLRGGQKTSRDGVATFKTIYPGWYRGRTTHIHVKVHVDGNEVHTGQLYFDDALTESVNSEAPYNSRGGTPDTTNASDGIYAQGGEQSTVKVETSGDGYRGALTMGVAT